MCDAEITLAVLRSPLPSVRAANRRANFAASMLHSQLILRSRSGNVVSSAVVVLTKLISSEMSVGYYSRIEMYSMDLVARELVCRVDCRSVANDSVLPAAGKLPSCPVVRAVRRIKVIPRRLNEISRSLDFVFLDRNIPEGVSNSPVTWNFTSQLDVNLGKLIIDSHAAISSLWLKLASRSLRVLKVSPKVADKSRYLRNVLNYSNYNYARGDVRVLSNSNE
ncbi:hypothetical protein K0M31_002062 [Melipona bicolor]|uniref:Uncharacterized protein n=1 Tax=Melipona bicolor TaxID=60889 RepID=A0AA40GGU8_9HYME|nr:hypothetical protein K0M31_002062 [Melipona bicolor]